jgi:PadR family transcriptional regulator, regulatory protein PadR
MSAQPAVDPDLHLRKFQKELSAGTVSLALLAVLGEAAEPMYGYQIAKRLEQLEGVLAGKQSALYPVLRGLEGAGLLESHVEPSVSGPPRRYYRINDTGHAVLAHWARAWRGTRDSVDAVLGPLACSEPASTDPSDTRGDIA